MSFVVVCNVSLLSVLFILHFLNLSWLYALLRENYSCEMVNEWLMAWNFFGFVEFLAKFAEFKVIFLNFVEFSLNFAKNSAKFTLCLVIASR